MKKFKSLLLVFLVALLFTSCDLEVTPNWGISDINPPDWLIGTYVENKYSSFDFTSDNVIEHSFSISKSYKDKADSYTTITSKTTTTDGKRAFIVVESKKYLSDKWYVFTEIEENLISIKIKYTDTTIDYGLYVKQ